MRHLWPQETVGQPNNTYQTRLCGAGAQVVFHQRPEHVRFLFVLVPHWKLVKLSDRKTLEITLIATQYDDMSTCIRKNIIYVAEINLPLCRWHNRMTKGGRSGDGWRRKFVRMHSICSCIEHLKYVRQWPRVQSESGNENKTVHYAHKHYDFSCLPAARSRQIYDRDQSSTNLGNYPPSDVW